jgi:penicillin-binding protein 1A
MNESLTAGEPLAPPPNDGQPRRQPKAARTTRPRRSLFRRFVRGVLGGLLAIVVLVALLGGGVGYVAYERFSANLPDVDGLRNYQPRVMSRVYAGDARLMAELATERRIFVPYSAIPETVKQAFVSAEDQNF